MSDVKTSLRGIDEPHYNYLKAFYLSFFSDKLYIDVGKRWKGLSVGYLFLVCLIAALPFTVRMISNFNQYFNEEVTSPLKNLPPFYLQNGQVLFDKPQPYFVKDQAGKLVAIIDTTGTINKIDNKYPDLSILILKDRLIYRLPEPKFFKSDTATKPQFKVNETVFTKDMNQYFDGSQWINSSGVPKLKFFILFFIYPIIVVSAFFVYLLLSLMAAVLGQVVSLAIFKFSLSYKQAFRLLIVALTPHITLFLIAFAFNLVFPGMGIIMVFLIGIYFSFAILCLRKDSKKLVHA